MACMTHYCLDCGWVAVNNSPAPVKCDFCGRRCSRKFDEVDEPEEDEEVEVDE